jgi:ribosomal protein S18 acetylase RimI-like enzyme
MSIEITTFRSEHARSFGELNREWLERYHLMEPSEVEQLEDPERYFIGGGGRIFVALDDGRVIGTCAIMPHGEDEAELAKLAVANAFRGRGIARSLVERCLAFAREQGIRRVVLVSNSQLKTALRLYETLGFRYGEVPAGTQYESADIYMALELDRQR